MADQPAFADATQFRRAAAYSDDPLPDAMRKDDDGVEGPAIRNFGASEVGGFARMMIVPFAKDPLPPHDSALDRVAEVVDPVLAPLGFAGGQADADGVRAQVIFCRGAIGSSDGACVDLVVDLEATPHWRVSDVRYWGYRSDRWHLALQADSSLNAQLASLARSLPDELA